MDIAERLDFCARTLKSGLEIVKAAINPADATSASDDTFLRLETPLALEDIEQALAEIEQITREIRQAPGAASSASTLPTQKTGSSG